MSDQEESVPKIENEKTMEELFKAQPTIQDPSSDESDENNPTPKMPTKSSKDSPPLSEGAFKTSHDSLKGPKGTVGRSASFGESEQSKGASKDWAHAVCPHGIDIIAPKPSLPRRAAPTASRRQQASSSSPLYYRLVRNDEYPLETPRYQTIPRSRYHQPYTPAPYIRQLRQPSLVRRMAPPIRQQIPSSFGYMNQVPSSARYSPYQTARARIPAYQTQMRTAQRQPPVILSRTKVPEGGYDTIVKIRTPEKFDWRSGTIPVQFSINVPISSLVQGRNVQACRCPDTPDTQPKKGNEL